MTFRELHQGNPIYILDKNTFEVKEGNVVGITAPHYDPKAILQQAGGLVVDISININGNTTQYVAAENAQSTCVGNLIILPSLDNLLNEVRATKTLAEEALKNVEFNKTTVSKCDKLLTEYDPIYKKDKLTEDRLTHLENTQANIAKLLEEINKKLK